MLLLILLLGTVISVYSERCPSYEEIAPCTCKNVENTGDIMVKCRNQDKLKTEVLSNVIKNLTGKKNVQMELYHYDVRKIPFNFFEGIGVKTLQLFNCDLPDITHDEDVILVGLEDSIEELQVMYCITEDNDLSKLRFGHLRKLKALAFGFNTITEVTNSWFDNSALEVIELGRNNIEKLGDRVFASVSNLKRLELSGNDFGLLKRSMLPSSAKQLTNLYLMHNNFKSLEADVFSNMPALREVSLYSNEIPTLEQDTWETVWEQLDYVDIDDNPLECDSRLNWTLDLRHPRRTDGICKGPVKMEGRSLESFIDNKGQ